MRAVPESPVVFGDATAEQTGRSQLGPPPVNPWWFAPVVFVVLLGIMAGALVASWAWS